MHKKLKLQTMKSRRWQCFRDYRALDIFSLKIIHLKCTLFKSLVLILFDAPYIT